MKLHEYQSRDLLRSYGVAVPGGIVVDTADEAKAAFDKLAADGCTLAVVKAQVHAGGRGKGGGVKLAKSADECFGYAETILSKPLVTPQTGPEGVEVKKLLIADGVDIARELYLGMVVDRAAGKPVMMASTEGGMEIEEVAAATPEKILKVHVDPDAGLMPYQARELAFKLGFEGKQVGQAVKIMLNLATLFLKRDADMVEINPLVVTPATEAHPDGQVLAIDAKISFDGNALYRQKDLAEQEDKSENDPAEERAAEHGLSYINLDGNIGCLVNGAGLAMATMDIIKHYGGEPANFLDVGGSASQEAVTEAFRIILSDNNVKGILVNIFGGIAKCDIIASAIVAAAREVGFSIPLVVRLEGTNVEPAKEILEAAKGELPTLIVGSDLADAAEKVVAAIN